MIAKNIPLEKSHESYKRLNEKWQSIYEERRRKVSKKRATISANAVIYSEILKEFLEENSKKRDHNKISILVEEEKKYNDYEIGDVKIIVTTEQKVLNDFPNAERKGKFKDMNDAFEREILSKLIEKYEVAIHPEMYYVIVGDK